MRKRKSLEHWEKWKLKNGKMEHLGKNVNNNLEDCDFRHVSLTLVKPRILCCCEHVVTRKCKSEHASFRSLRHHVYCKTAANLI